MYKENDKSDNELVVLALNDPNYFGILMERYEGKLLTYIRRISSVTHEDAEDILQNSFLKAYQNLNNFDKELTFSSWIYRIVHNETVSMWRKNKARPQGNVAQVDDEFLERIVDNVDIVADVDREFLRKVIDKLLDDMDDKYREILILKYIEDKSYDEISDILKKPAGTVATHLNRAKKQFRDLYKKQKVKSLS